MNRSDIEYYNGLTKAIIACTCIVENSTSLEEAKTKLSLLKTRMNQKVVRMVDSDLY